MKEISKFQLELINSCKSFLKKQEKDNIDICLSPLCFFTIWANSPGRYKVLDIINKSEFKKYFFSIKNVLSISRDFDLDLHHEKNFLINNKSTIIVSYASSLNFDRNGNFYDNYFNIGTNNKKIFWFLISLDNYIPKRINKSIAIVAKRKKNSFSFYYLIKYLFNLVTNKYFSLKKIQHYCWREYHYAIKVTEFFKKIQTKTKAKNILLNYEGVPFQNNILTQAKKINKKINTFGYLHCAPWPVQTDLIYKNQNIDNLIVSSTDQKRVLKKYFGWKKKKISIVPSLRFKKNKNKTLSGFIFVPYNLEKFNEYIHMFESYISSKKNFNFKKLSVRIHPLNKYSSKHLRFKKKISSILSYYKNQGTNRKSKNLSLFFGSATGVCVQALEEGTTIIHFPQNPTLDVFSNKFWPNLKVKKIGKNIFEYNLLKANKTFLVNNEPNKFNKYFNKFLK